jgi:hypothetical protein
MGVKNSTGKYANELAELKNNIGPDILQKLAKFYDENYFDPIDGNFYDLANRPKEKYGFPIFEKKQVTQTEHYFACFKIGRVKVMLFGDSHFTAYVKDAEVNYTHYFDYTNVIPFLIDDEKRQSYTALVEKAPIDPQSVSSVSLFYKYMYMEYLYHRQTPDNHVKYVDFRILVENKPFRLVEYVIYFTFHLYRLILMAKNRPQERMSPLGQSFMSTELTEDDLKISNTINNYTNNYATSNKELFDKFMKYAHIEDFENEYKTSMSGNPDITFLLSTLCSSAYYLMNSGLFHLFPAANLFTYITRMFPADILANPVQFTHDTLIISENTYTENRKHINHFMYVMDLVFIAEFAKLYDKNQDNTMFYIAGSFHFVIISDLFNNTSYIADNLPDYVNDSNVFITPYKLFASYYRRNFKEFCDDYPLLYTLGNLERLALAFLSVLHQTILSPEANALDRIEGAEQTKSVVLRYRTYMKLLDDGYFQGLMKYAGIYMRLFYNKFAVYLYCNRLREKDDYLVLDSMDSDTKVTVGTKKSEEEKKQYDANEQKIKEDALSFQAKCIKMLNTLVNINIDRYSSVTGELKALLGPKFIDGNNQISLMSNRQILTDIVKGFTPSVHYKGGNADLERCERYLREYNLSFDDVKQYPTGVNINDVKEKIIGQLSHTDEIIKESHCMQDTYDLNLLYRTYLEYTGREPANPAKQDTRTAITVGGDYHKLYYLIAIIVALIIVGIIVINAVLTTGKSPAFSDAGGRYVDLNQLDARW